MLDGTVPWVQERPLVLSQGKGGDGFCLRSSEVVELRMGRSRRRAARDAPAQSGRKPVRLVLGADGVFKKINDEDNQS